MGLFIDKRVRERVDHLELPFNRFGVDPFGISKKHLAFSMTVLSRFFKHYFSVRSFGADKVPARGRCMLVGNHSGGVAIDGAMVIASMFLEKDPPRLAQAMTEKFLSDLPFFSELLNRTGQFTGLPEHATRLLRDERLLLVFPEGAKGTAKLYRERYSLVDFGSGFMRLAFQTRSPIVPFAFLGGGEAVPTIVNAYALGKLIGAPYVPVTPYLLAVPLPVRLEVRYGAPMTFEGNGSENDETINGYVEEVKGAIRRMLDEGKRWRESGSFRLSA